MKSKGSVFHHGEGSGNFILICEFKYGQTWEIWRSPLRLSLYSTFKKMFRKSPASNAWAAIFKEADFS